MTTLKEKVAQIAPDVFIDTPVQFGYLYGSVARDLHNRFSDLDVAIFVEGLNRDASLNLELSLSLVMDELLGHTIETELRILNDLPMVIQGDIVTTGILIYCRDDAKRVEFETSLRMRYFDFLPVFERSQIERLGIER